jgi:hypothetical protein
MVYLLWVAIDGIRFTNTQVGLMISGVGQVAVVLVESVSRVSCAAWRLQGSRTLVVNRWHVTQLRRAAGNA